MQTSPVKVYFDIEGTPEENYVYLIGMIVVDGETEKRFSFWADSKTDERAIFEKFVAALSEFNEFVLFSYGAYEQAFLKRMQKDEDLKPHADAILKASVNILSTIYAHVYFPTYSNGLKDIGSFLGCNWSDPDASGRQSMYWRAQWEATGDDDWKRKLVEYNLEDCVALKVVADQINALAVKSDANTEAGQLGTGASSLRIARVQETDQHGRTRKWGEVNFVNQDYAYVNRCACAGINGKRSASKPIRRSESTYLEETGVPESTI